MSFELLELDVMYDAAETVDTNPEAGGVFDELANNSVDTNGLDDPVVDDTPAVVEEVGSDVTYDKPPICDNKKDCEEILIGKMIAAGVIVGVATTGGVYTWRKNRNSRNRDEAEDNKS